MGKVFVEYKIEPSLRSDYLRFIKHMQEQSPDFELLEGTDQPGLFVEIWPNLTQEQYIKMKEERLNTANSPWNELASYVIGGNEKIHIWSFQIVIAK